MNIVSWKGDQRKLICGGSWLENQSMDEILEFDSFINIHNNQIHGFPRGGMGILDSDIMAKATEVICKWIQF